jgi:hypothetical protein
MDGWKVGEMQNNFSMDSSSLVANLSGYLSFCLGWGEGEVV